MTTHTITGTWFDDNGFVADLAPLTLAVEIINGEAYDPDLAPLGGKIAIKDGEMRCWAVSYFVPDAGELARVGLA
jgi:hypothetical protein